MIDGEGALGDSDETKRLPAIDNHRRWLEAAKVLGCATIRVHVAWISENDRAFAKRLARYGARTPVPLERLTYDRATKAVTYRSDNSEGSTAGTETADPLEFLARVLVHIPHNGHVPTR